MRAFLKELDVSNNVWIGLRQSKPYGELVWTDFKPLTNQEHWHEPITQSESTVCVASDPSADFRWHGFNCGGPEVASFICEIPVPDWAQRDGCLPTALPSLTVTYLPEQSAVELISDCGLDGSRRVICQGHRSREAIMRELSCETVTESPVDDNAITFGNDLQTRHRRDTVQPSEATTATSVVSTSTTKAEITKTPTSATVEATKTTKTVTKAPMVTETTTKAVVPSTTDAANVQRLVEQAKTKTVDFSGSLDLSEDVKDSSEAPQEMSIAEEPIKLRAQEVSNNPEPTDIDQIKMENKSIEIDSTNSNSVQKVTESFTVLKPALYWPIGVNDKSSLASDESIEDLRNLKGSIQNMVLNKTAVKANNTNSSETSKPVSTSPSSPVSPSEHETTISPEELQRRKEAILAHIFATPPSTKPRPSTVEPKSVTQNAATKIALTDSPNTKATTIMPTPSHLKEESHEIFGEKTSKKVKKMILGSKLNNFDVTTTAPAKHEYGVQTTSNRFICKNLPPVLLYNKNENEQRQIEQVLTPGGIETTQYSTTPEELHADKSKLNDKHHKVDRQSTVNISRNNEVPRVIEAVDQKVATEKAPAAQSSNVDAGTVTSTAKIEISTFKPTLVDIVTQKSVAATQASTGAPANRSKVVTSTKLNPKPTTFIFSSDPDVLLSLETATKLADKSQALKATEKYEDVSELATERKSSEETTTEKASETPTSERPGHHGFLESSDVDVPERPNRGRLLIHPQHHSFYPYFLNRVLG